MRSLLAQDYPEDGYEVIVVDDGSVDETPQVVRALERRYGSRLRYFPQRARGLNAARNVGLRAANGDPICFVDDDVVVSPWWLAELARAAVANPEVACLGGPIYLRIEGKPPRLCRRREPLATALDLGPDNRLVGPNREDVDAGAAGQGLFGGNMAVRRAAVALVGEFDETLSGPGDETEWQRRLERLGGKLLYVGQAGVWHRRTAPSLRFRALVRQKFVTGRRHIAYLAVVGDSFSPWHEFTRAVLAVGHAIRRRCCFGLFAASLHLGRIWGWITDDNRPVGGCPRPGARPAPPRSR